MNECKKCTHFLLNTLLYGSKWSKYFFAKQNLFFFAEKKHISPVQLAENKTSLFIILLLRYSY